jgi:hypothetical protein
VAAANREDPVSQYELAQILGYQNQQYEPLLNSAAPKLFQAKGALYKLYLER